MHRPNKKAQFQLAATYPIDMIGALMKRHNHRLSSSEATPCAA
jgi:hypothetical protein